MHSRDSGHKCDPEQNFNDSSEVKAGGTILFRVELSEYETLWLGRILQGRDIGFKQGYALKNIICQACNYFCMHRGRISHYRKQTPPNI